MAKLVLKRIGLSLAALVAAGQSHALAEPTLDKLLATVNVTGTSTCSHVELKLNRPVNVTGADPAEKALDIAVHIEPLATTLPTETGKSLKEAASVPPQNAAGIGGVVYDPAATQGPVIHFVFSKVMAYHIKRDDDNRHIVIDVTDVATAEKCLGFKPSVADQGPKTDLKKSLDNPDQAPDAQGSGQDAETALSDGKKQLAAGDFNRATAFFTKAASLGSGRVKQDAQEMLGLSHERAGQLAFAKAEYDTYLSQYPTGPDATRVKGRRDAVIAAMDDQANKQFALRQASTLTSNGAGKGDATLTPGNGVLASNLGLKSNLGEPPKDPKAWTWTKNGSISQTYYRDDNFSPLTPGGNVMDQHRVFQNQALSTGDFFIRGENQDYAVEGRASAVNVQGIGEQANIANSSLSTVYVDGKLKGPKLGLRVGRQSKSTGGVFGRFDGAVVTWEGIKDFKWQAVGGAPVYNSNANPFSDGRYIFGTSLEYNSPKKDWSASIYAIEQNVGDIVDRRAVGGEGRYIGSKGSVYTAADYDIFFMELNNAYVTGTWLPRQGTSVYATADYRKLPFLLTSNALQGQSQLTLQSLVDAVGLDAVNQWAGDRTSSSQSLSVGASQQLNDKWQASLDSTLSYYTGTPPSGGVLGTPDPGFDFYASLSINGSGIFRTNDTLSGGLRYATSASSTGYMIDGAYRFQVNDKLRFGPRLQLQMRTSKTSDQVQYSVLPSVNMSYRVNKNWTLESEVGARWINTVNAGVGNQSLDILASAGYRFEFQ